MPGGRGRNGRLARRGRKRRIEGSGDDLPASESSHVPTSTPKAVGRPKKDILAICAEAQKSFDIATADALATRCLGLPAGSSKRHSRHFT